MGLTDAKKDKLYSLSKIRTTRNTKDLTVSVIGDFMIDVYIHGECERISQEAPVPVVSQTHEVRIPGGAGNVARNFSSLRLKMVNCHGVMGLRSFDILDEYENIKNYIHYEKNRNTTTKKRLIANGHHIARIDIETLTKIKKETEYKIFQDFMETEKDFVVISDYDKGVITQNLLNSVVNYCNEKNIHIYMDPKPSNKILLNNIYCITPNLKEAIELGEYNYDKNIDLIQNMVILAKKLFDLYHIKYILITLGKEGMVIFDSGTYVYHAPTKAKEVFDVSGAGDTVLSVFSSNIECGVDIHTSLNIANLAAGYVISKMGTYSITLRELEQLFYDDFVDNLD